MNVIVAIVFVLMDSMASIANAQIVISIVISREQIVYVENVFVNMVGRVIAAIVKTVPMVV